jgi:heterotetrameric sarcosine oxidase gamma subunit
MLETLQKESVFDTGINLASNCGLILSEVINRWLWVIQPNAQFNLNQFSRQIFNQDIKSGEVITNQQSRLICVSPRNALLLSSDTQAHSSFPGFDAMATDVSHGYCELNLSGKNAKRFLNSYISADFDRTDTLKAGALRCLLGQYDLWLWWDDIEQIHLIVERSFSLSFVEYLKALSLRWGADDDNGQRFKDASLILTAYDTVLAVSPDLVEKGAL